MQYQWLRDGQPISGQTGSSYTLTRDDAGHKITVRATYKDNAGHDETPLSEATATVTDTSAPNPQPQPNHEGKISISGEAKVGQTLTAAVSDDDGVPANVQYQWLRDGSPISGQTGATYQLTRDDAGHKITVRATYKDNAGHNENPLSEATAAVADVPAPNPQPNPQPNPNPQPQPQPNHEGKISISGEAKVGQTMTATVSDDDGVPSNVQYQWLRDGQPISGQTGATYQLTRDDAGHKITVRATYKDNAGHDENPLSEATATVTDTPAPNPPPQPNHEGKISISGEAKVGQTLTAAVSDDNGVPADVQYQWYADGVAIQNATAATYTLLASDKGKVITVRATYTDNEQYSEAPVSRGTAPIQEADAHIFKNIYELRAATGLKAGDKAVIVDFDSEYDDIALEFTVQDSLPDKTAGTANRLAQPLANGKFAILQTDDYTLPVENSAANVEAMLAVAKTYLDAGDALVWNADGGTPLYTNKPAPVGTINGHNVYAITCSAFVNMVIGGWKYEDTTYNPANETSHSSYGWGVDFNDHAPGKENRPYGANRLLKWLYSKDQVALYNGDAANPNYKVGDILFFSQQNPEGRDLNDSIYFMNAYHTGIYYGKDAQGRDLILHSAGTYHGNGVVVEVMSEELKSNLSYIARPHLGNSTVTISGEAEVGNTLTATVADVDGLPDSGITYQWYADNLAISGATGNTYTLSDSDKGKVITVRAKFTDDSHYAEAPTSAGTAAVAEHTPPNQPGSIAISGEAKVGSTLTATITDSDGVAADKVQYQWQRDGQPITQANGKTYTLTPDDAGHKISVQATYKDNAGHDESPTSEATASVADNANAPLMHDDFSSYPLHKTYVDNDTFGAWKVAFAGYGNVEIIDNGGGNQALQLKPMARSGETETSSAMVLGTVQTGDEFTYSGTIATPEQLRQGATPNAWETAWLVWNHSDNDHYYYFVARANGWELGKRDPAYSGGQRFMATGSESWPLAEPKNFVVTKSGNTVEISINGKVITTFTDDENPYTGGTIGLYTEDARIVADDINLTATANITGTANHGGVASINGKAATGEVLHAAISDGDGAVSNVSYQWMAAGKEISGATGETYAVTADNSGKIISVRVTYTDSTGKVESVISPPTAVVDSGNDGGANQRGQVTLSGTAAVGETLTANVSDGDGLPDRIQYTWLANGAAINGANGSSYTITAADVGKIISVQVYYYDKAGHEENLLSDATNAVTDTAPPPAENHAPTGSVTITGEAVVGKTLNASNDLADEDGLGNITYHWLADGKEIGTGASYTLTEAEKGKTITVKATYTDGKGTAEAVESRATDAVAEDTPPPAENHAPTGAVTVSGVVQVGETLVAGNNLADEDGMGQVSYQWLRDGQDISGATSDKYTLTDADAGHQISVRASYTDGANNAEQKASFTTGNTAAAGSAPTYHDTSGQAEIEWAGVKWYVRDSDWNSGSPGSGNWSRGNKQIDGTDMHMSLTNPDGKTPIASEIISSNAMGYGTYETTFRADFSKFDPYTVFGFFTFEWSQTTVPGNREIDGIEVSRWGDPTLKGVFTYYPPSAADNGIKMRPGYTWAEDVKHVSMKLEWQPNKITWTLRNAENGEVLHQVESTRDIPDAANQQVHFNLWTYKPTDPPNEWWTAAPQKVTLGSFNYTPLAGGNNPPPANKEGTVTISGDAKVGGVLTATVNDSDGFVADKVQYQWLRDGQPIDKANGSTYTLSKDDAGHKISVQATYKDNTGHDESPTSEVTDIPAPPANHEGTVTISGEAKVGSELTATVTDADKFDAANVQYQWLRDGQPIDKANGSTYTLTKDDAGHKISVQATYKDNAGHDESPTSEVTDIPAPPPNQLGTVSITGEALVGKTLTATIDDKDGVDPAQAHYQWLVDGKAVDGATNATYKVRPEDAGKAISVHVEYTDNAAHDEKLDSSAADATVDHHSGYKLVWKDEFDGTTLNRDNWGYQTGGWNSSKVQNYYSDSDKNVSVSDGSLKITAHHESTPIKTGSGENEKSYDFSSGFVQTQGKQAWTYGYFEARLKMPNAENGSLWPAFWMSPDKAKYGGWPRSGEIDVLETRSYINNEDRDHDGQIKVAADAHWGTGYGKGNHRHKQGITYVDGSDEWHTYAVKWQEGKLEYYVDGRHYHTIDNFAAPNATEHPGPFNIPFYLRLNVAVGGDYMTGKYQDAHNSIDKFPATMEVDYVRVYQLDGTPPTPPQTNHAPTGSVSISGSPRVGETLTAANTLADEDGLGNITYHWLADGHEIGQGASYTLTEAEKGKTISVRAEYTDGKGTPEAVESEGTAAIGDPVTPPTATLSGAENVNEGEAAEYTVTLDKASDQPVTLTLKLTHGETTDGDLGSISKTLTIPAGETSAKVSLQTTADGIPENTEHYTLSISGAEGATVGADKAVTTAIADNDEKAAYHTGSVADSTFVGDRSANNHYFVNSLDSTQRATYGHYSGHKAGEGLRITYAFSEDGVENGKVVDGHRPFSAQQKADIRTVLDHLEEHVNVKFTEGSNATLNFYLHNLGNGTSGYGVYGGNVHVNTHYYTADDAFAQKPLYTVDTATHNLTLKHGWVTVLHEIGHSLGMDHPFGHADSSLDINKAEDRNDLTVMSYTTGQYDYDVDLGEGWTSPKVPLSPTKLGIYDLAALHHAYGINPNYHSGDDTYGFKPFNKDAVGNDIYIHDGGGQDTFDASEQTLDLNIDLTPGSWIYAGSKAEHLALDDSGNPTTGQAFIGYGTQIESAKGGTGNDTIKGNSAANYLFGFDGNDNIDGGAGNDQIEGGRGNDTLKGGAGGDTFLFRSPFDGTIDTLLDFKAAEGDRIQLDHNIFTGLQKGSLSAEQFVKGTEAKDADDHIIYNQATGELAYDADGNGSGAAVTIARLGINTELEQNHIQII